MKRILPIIFLFFTHASAIMAIGNRALGDSLTQYLGFPKCVPNVVVKNVAEKNGTLTVRCGKAISGKAMNRQELRDLKRKVAYWVNPKNPATIVNIYSDDHELEELIIKDINSQSCDTNITMSGRTIALWGSHGRYYKIENGEAEGRWVWQRARLWQTVEDRLTTEFSTRLREQLENAGVTILEPRPTPDSNQGKQIGKSGLPRWMEAATYWLRDQDLPASVWNAKDDTYKSDILCRPLWVNYLAENGTPIDYAIALHTDGYEEPGDNQMVGTLAIYTETDNDGKRDLLDGRNRMRVCRQMAHVVQRQLVNDMRQLVDPNWPERQLQNANYGETRVCKIPSMILEIASHKDYSDIRYLLDPETETQIARAIYKGLARAIAGEKVCITPLPPHDIYGKLQQQHILLTWQETVDSLEQTARAQYYIVEQKENNTWKEVARTSSCSISLEIRNGIAYQWRVRAANHAGKSLASYPIGAYVSQRAAQSVLIVNAFSKTSGPEWFADSLRIGIVPGKYGIPDQQSYAFMGAQHDYDRTSKWISDDECGLGMCSTEWQDIVMAGNTHDYHLMHGEELAKMDVSYIAVPYSSAILQDTTRQFAIVDIICGQETRYRDSDKDALLSPNVWPGMKMLVSGAFIGTGAEVRESKLTPYYLVKTQPNPDVLYCNRANSVRGSKTLYRWSESGLPAIVKKGNKISVGLMLESIEHWQVLYRQLILN